VKAEKYIEDNKIEELMNVKIAAFLFGENF